MKLTTLCLFLCIHYFGFTQSNPIIDSLEHVVIGSSHDTLKTFAYSDLCWEYRFVDQQKAINNGLKGIQLSRQIKYPLGEGKTLNDLSIIYIDMGKLDSAIILLNQAKSIRQSLNDQMGVAAIHNKLGIIYEHKEELEKALIEHFSALKIYEKLDVKANIGFCKNNIANVHFNLNDYNKALEIHKEALEIRIEIDDKYGIAGSHANLGNTYMYMGDSLNAITHFNVAVEMYRKMENEMELAVCLNNLGSIYNQQGRFNLSKPFLEEALEIRERLNDGRGICSTKLLLGVLYANSNGASLNKAESYLRDGLKRSLESGYKKSEQEAYKNLAFLFKQKGNIDSSYHYSKLHVMSIELEYEVNLQDKVSELQTIYETEKKDRANETLARINAELDTKRKAAELKLANRNKWIIGIGLGSITLLLMALLLIQRNKAKAKALLQIKLDEEKTKGVKAVFESQEKERSRISKDLHDGIGQQLSGLKMAWNTISSKLLKTSNTEYTELIELTKILDEATNDIRNLSHQMMPKTLKEFGLVLAIEDMLEKSFMFMDIKFEYEHFGLNNERFSEAVEVGLYRISQELVNNIIKHSNAKEVTVQLFKTSNKLQLIVTDNGIGYNQSQKDEGHGLANIKTRLSTINGSCSVESENGAISRIVIEL